MNIYHTSLKEFRKLTPSLDTMVISLLGDDGEHKVIENSGWKKALVVDFDVASDLDQEGQVLEKAESVGQFIKEELVEAEKVIVYCSHGRLPSACVAAALAHAMSTPEPQAIVLGKLQVISNEAYTPVFAQSVGAISSGIRKVSENAAE